MPDKYILQDMKCILEIQEPQSRLFENTYIFKDFFGGKKVKTNWLG